MEFSHESMVDFGQECGLIQQISIFRHCDKGLCCTPNGQIFNINLKEIKQGHIRLDKFIPEDLDIGVLSLCVSNDEKLIMVCKEDTSPIIYDWQGLQRLELLAGDMYLRDSRLSKGHTKYVTSSLFDLNEDNKIYSCSLDGSLWLWDLESKLFGVQQKLASERADIFRDRNKKNIPLKKIIQSGLKNCIFVFGTNGEIGQFDSREKNIKNFPIQDWSGILVDACVVNWEWHIFKQTEELLEVVDIWNPDKKFFDCKWTNLNEFSKAYFQEEQNWVYFYSTEQNINLLNYLDLDDLQSCRIQNAWELSANRVGGLQIYQDQLLVGLDQQIMVLSKTPFLNKEFTQQQNKFQEVVSDPHVYAPHLLPIFWTNDETQRYRIDKIWQDENLSNKPEVILNGPGYGGYISGPWTVAQNLMWTLHMIKPQPQPTNQSKKIHKTQEQPLQGKSVQTAISKCPQCGFRLCDCRPN